MDEDTYTTILKMLKRCQLKDATVPDQDRKMVEIEDVQLVDGTQ